MSFSSDIPLQANQVSISLDIPEVNDPNFRNILMLYLKRLVDSINTKEGSLYLLQEQADFQQYFFPGSFDANSGQTTRNGYRTVFDLVALNGGVIGAGTTPIALTATTTPPLINGVSIPVDGYGAATIAGPIYYFINDPDVYVRFDNTVPAAQVINITNNTGSDLIQCYWVFEYLKN